MSCDAQPNGRAVHHHLQAEAIQELFDHSDVCLKFGGTEADSFVVDAVDQHLDIRFAQAVGGDGDLSDVA